MVPLAEPLTNKQPVQIAQAGPLAAPQQAPTPATPAPAPAAIPYQKWADGEVTYIISDDERRAFKRLTSDEERQKFITQLARPPVPVRARTTAASPYQKWLDEEVVYIISDDERRAFSRLRTDDERQKFIEQFWLRRDPTPGTEENEMKEEHYRRIAFANDHFAESIPGWKTDRGAIYIKYGPPDAIDSHGATPATYPYEMWRYRFIEGMGTNVELEFVDPTMTGRYHLTKDPTEKQRQ